MRQRGDSWRLRVSLPPDGTGKRRYLTATVQGGKREAQAALNKLLVQAQERTAPLLDARTKLGDFLDKSVEARTDIRDTSRYAMQRVVKAQIKPRLGEMRVVRLSSLDLDAMYAAMQRDGLAGGYILSAHQIIASALHAAVRAGLLPRAVTDQANPPRRERNKPAIPSGDDLQRVIEAAPHLRVPLLLMAASGIRRGELLGLTWDRVDFERGTVRIDRQVVDVGKSVRLSQPKSESAERTLALPAAVMDLLRTHRKEQLQHRMATGQRPVIDLLFPGPHGGLAQPDTFSVQVAQAGRKAGVRLHPHLLRHVHVSELLRARVPMSVVKDRVGHASIATTVDVYGHLLDESEQQVIDAVQTMVTKLVTK